MVPKRKAPQMNGASFGARDVIASILDSDALRASVHFSSEVHRGEPIITTGRQMASYLPDRYREMRDMARTGRGSTGRTISTASSVELFYRQARFMEDFEDDCPYRGDVRLYFPTYGSMSDHQLRGYFTWRAHVRRGELPEAPLTFVYLHIYELLCGVGAPDALCAHRAIETLWQHYRTAYPTMDCNLTQWLTDHVAYHGLDLSLLEHDDALAFDRALAEVDSSLAALEREAIAPPSRRKRAKAAPSVLPLPACSALERQLADALDVVSTYQLSKSRFMREDPEGLRHVTCSVFVRLSDYYRKHRALELVDTLFGQEVTSPHTMFRLALFHAEHPHADAEVTIAPGVTYTCDHGFWTITRRHASRERSTRLGGTMHSIDRSLRQAEEFDHPLKERKGTPKYVQAMIDTEVEAWLAWKDVHAPVRIQVDLSLLAGIRNAAAKTREALLIDEEREGWRGPEDQGDAIGAAPCGPGADDPGPAAEGTPTPEAAAPADPRALYLHALLEHDSQERASALRHFGKSEDMLVDAINEMMFDTVGDTVIEFGTNGPELIEDYRTDVEEYVSHAR